MHNWLAKVQAPKFLRYLFFIAFSWYKGYKSEQADEHLTASLLIALPHISIPFVLSTVLRVLGLDVHFNFTDLEIIFFCLFIIIIHYLFYVYNNKWKLIAEEFRYISKNKRVVGLFYLFIYL